MSDLEQRKLDFISEVNTINDDRDFTALEKTLQQIKQRQRSARKLKSVKLRKKFDREAIKRNHGFKTHDKEGIFKIIREMDVREPVELLLSQLTK